MQKLVRHLDLVRHLVRRDFLLNYRRSALGIFWSLLLPLFQLLVLAFVFQYIVPLGIEAYPAFLFSALLPWMWFSTCVNGATGLFIANRDLMRRPSFAPGILVLVSALSNLVTYLCAVPVLIAVLVWFGRPLTSAMAAFPLLLAIEGLLIVGLGLIVATLNVLYRDVQYVVSVALMLLFYLTPVFYSGDTAVPGYAIVAVINPLALIIESYRDIFFDGVAPPVGRLALSMVTSIAVCGIGYWVYRSLEPDLVDVA